MTRHDVLGLGAALAVCYGAAAVGAQFTPGAWYAQLSKPSWTPPGWVFAPVWTVLYAVMAVAAWGVWRARATSEVVVLALCIFAVQLILNTLWSWLFFGLRRADLAMLDIALLWGAIVATVIAFWQVRAWAGALLIPYLVWVSFAAALNWQIWRLNTA